MSNLFKSLKLKIGYIFRVSLFIVTLVIVLIFFPRQGKFRYEFKKSSPWQHVDLIAPFDFSIFKTDMELQQERESILSNYKPYFRVNKSVESNQIQLFNLKYKLVWNAIEAEINTSNSWTERRIQAEKDKVLEFFGQKLYFIYYKGIIDVTGLEDNFMDNHNSLMIIRDNVAVETDKTEIFTLKTAYEYLNQQWVEYIKQNTLQYANANIFKQLTIDSYLLPNLNYDKETSDLEKNELINSISVTQGMVQKGERIILKGDIVDNQKYKILESLKRNYEAQMGVSSSFYLVIIGQALLVSFAFLMLFLFINQFRREILDDTRKTLFILFIITIFIIIISVLFKSEVLILDSTAISIYAIPFAIVPILIKTFYDARLALFVHIITIFLAGFYAPNSYEFIFISFFAGLVAIFSLSNLYRRGKLFLTSFLIILAYSIIYLSLSIIQEASIENIDWKVFIGFGINGVLLLLSFPLTYVFEKAFGFLSDATLVELADTNQPLLRRLAEEAPGTFQHSMQVASLAEEAIFHIGGNPLLVRTGALYHDIGKMFNPSYFVENQTPDFNPHDKLEANDSAKIIIQHVYDGIHLAKKYKIPSQIIDFIRTHHGTTKVQYFYRTYKQKYPDKEIDVVRFTYPGPKPFSKETATLMMADSVEAAARSIKDVSGDALEELVENIINYQQIEEQFNEADITFKDISTIKALFKAKLKNIYHARIEYPKEVKE